MAAVVCSRSSHGPPAASRPRQPPRTPNPSPDPPPRPHGLGHGGDRAGGRQLGGRTQTAMSARRPNPSGSKEIPGPKGPGPGIRGSLLGSQRRSPKPLTQRGRGSRPARRAASTLASLPGLPGPAGPRHPRPPTPPLLDLEEARGTWPAHLPLTPAPKVGSRAVRGARIHPGRGEARAHLRAQRTP